MLWFDPSLQMHASGDAWETTFCERTSNDPFTPPRPKRSMEYAAHYAYYLHQQHKYTRAETPTQRRRPWGHRRRVRFVSDEDRPLVVVIEIPNRTSLTPEQKNAMWYNGHDIRSFFRDARKAQDRVRAQNGCRCLQIRKCPTCRPLWRTMD